MPSQNKNLIWNIKGFFTQFSQSELCMVSLNTAKWDPYVNRHRENYRTGGPINMWKIQVSLASPPKVSQDPFFYIRFPTEGLPPRIFLTVGSDCHRFSSVLRCFYWQRTKDRWIARCRRESDKHAPKEFISQHTDAGFFFGKGICFGWTGSDSCQTHLRFFYLYCHQICIRLVHTIERHFIYLLLKFQQHLTVFIAVNNNHLRPLKPARWKRRHW